MKVLISPKNSSIAYFFGSKLKYLAICWYDAIILLCMPSRTSHCSLALPANWCISIKDNKLNWKIKRSATKQSKLKFVQKIKTVGFTDWYYVLYKTSYFPSVDFRQLSYDNTLSYVSDDILVVRLYKLFTNSEKKQKWHNTCKTSYMNQYETHTKWWSN